MLKLLKKEIDISVAVKIEKMTKCVLKVKEGRNRKNEKRKI